MAESNIQKEFRDLISVSSRMLRLKSVEQVCQLTADSMIRFTKFQRSVVSILEPDGTFARLGFGGLKKEEIDKLRDTPRSTLDNIRENLVDKFKIGRSYYLPYQKAKTGTKKKGEKAAGWHPEDFLFIPLYNPDDEMVGLISVDDPSDGAKPTEENLLPLELFATQVAALLENLRNVEKQQEMIQQLKAQQEVVMELSTPVIRIWEQVMVLPLIGAVDSMRAQQIMENVLLKISETNADVVIIDITGVPVIDTLVAAHLVKTVTAARLLGASTIITGIKSEIAQTLVQMGVDLGQVMTRSDLASGIEEALSMTGKKIQDISLKK